MKRNSRKIFLENKALYEAAIRRHVCEKCIDFGQDASCHSKDPEGCAVFRYLPELLRVALELRERNIEPYVKAVRRQICSQCKNAKGSDHCELRDNIDCGLNRYLPLVLNAVEEVNQKLNLR